MPLFLKFFKGSLLSYYRNLLSVPYLFEMRKSSVIFFKYLINVNFLLRLRESLLDQRSKTVVKIGEPEKFPISVAFLETQNLPYSLLSTTKNCGEPQHNTTAPALNEKPQGYHAFFYPFTLPLTSQISPRLLPNPIMLSVFQRFPIEIPFSSPPLPTQIPPLLALYTFVLSQFCSLNQRFLPPSLDFFRHGWLNNSLS